MFWILTISSAVFINFSTIKNVSSAKIKGLNLELLNNLQHLQLTDYHPCTPVKSTIISATQMLEHTLQLLIKVKPLPSVKTHFSSCYNNPSNTVADICGMEFSGQVGLLAMKPLSHLHFIHTVSNRPSFSLKHRH